jgi:RND family efflux transporter MFP subunit
MRTGQDVAVAEARLRQAEAEAARVAALYADRLIAAREHERAQADLAAARATMEAATGTQRLVRGGSRDAGGLTALRIDAPDGGVMRALHVGAGQSVAAGAPLAEILRTDRMWVRVPVYAGEAARFARGEATVHGLGGTSGGALGGPVLRAQRVAAPPSADATAASVDLFYEVRGGTASLRPGERVGVTIPLTGIGERRLVVPLAAVVRDLSGGSWVYERTDSVTFVRRRVEVAQVVGPNAVLAAGPKPGTVVVTAGAAELFGTEFGVGK